MFTICPNCLHVFPNPNSSSLQQEQHQNRILLQQQQQFTTPLPSPSSAPAVQFTPPCCVSNRQQEQQPPLLISLQLPRTSAVTTCTVSVSTTTDDQQQLSTSQRVRAGMAGGGIVQNSNTVTENMSVVLQHTTQDEQLVLPPWPPQPSPSTPVSFVLPSAPNVFTTGSSTLFPFQLTMSTAAISPTVTTSTIQTPRQSTLPSPAAAPWVFGLQMPPTQPIPQVPQSDTDLVRLAATMRALQTSGWYYEGLSWQESAEALQSTSPGTFLVRDSSDPRFLFSLSVQTERGPTNVRLHYVCGKFRLDAEPRLAPLMPLFECVVSLMEYYIEATKGRLRVTGGEEENYRKGSKGNHLRHKEVWVDARGHMYSHVLLTTPLFKKQQRPSLQHLARLSINRCLKAAGPPQFSSRDSRSIAVVTSQLPLPTLLKDYLQEYPYTH